MPDEKTRSYEVLALQGDGDEAWPAYVHVATLNANDADAAIKLAVDHEGLGPNPADNGRVVAVPTGNWNQRDVVIRQEPVIDVNPPAGAQATLAGTGEPGDG